MMPGGRSLCRSGRRAFHLGWRPGLIYLVSRAVVLLGLGIVVIAHGSSVGDRIDRWDSVWYLRAATQGYPSHVPVVHGHVVANTIAFFPALPLLIRAVSWLSTMSPFAAGVLVSSLSGLSATIGVWALVRHLAGDRAANRATIVFALFPGSFVFSLIYSEGLVITGIAFGLLALLRRRWVSAGLLGALATAAAPIALAFVMSAAWASLVALRQHREWRSLAAPILAPLGTVIYVLWTWQHTGTVFAFMRTEHDGWHSFLSAAYPVRVLLHVIAHPLTSVASQRLVFFCIVAAIVALVIARRDRLNTIVLLSGAGVAVLAMLTARVGPRPRLLLDAFPLIVAVGLRYRQGWRFVALSGLLTVGLIALTIYEAGSWAVFP